MSKIILETRGLTKHYGGVHALEDANFILHEGEHVAVVGDNGAGKSTFVRQVTAVEQRSGGEIIFDGQPVHFTGPLEARQAGIETVFQTLALADDLDVPSNLFLGRELFKFRLGPFSWLDRKTMRDRTMEALKTTAVKIPNVDNPIRNMSGGQRQCVSIARTAAFASKLVIMDEPTAALGVQETAQVDGLFAEHRLPGLHELLDQVGMGIRRRADHHRVDILRCRAGIDRTHVATILVGNRLRRSGHRIRHRHQFRGRVSCHRLRMNLPDAPRAQKPESDRHGLSLFKARHSLRQCLCRFSAVEQQVLRCVQA